MIRYFFLCSIVIFLASCKNVYYNTTETVHDEKKAISMITSLKKGVMVIQIPCEKRKLSVLEKQAKNEADPVKKDKYSNELANYKEYLKFIQKSLMEAASKEYKFSRYLFLPDSAVVAFKNGKRDNIFINDSFEFVNETEIEENELVLFLRGQRYYDFLYIHKWDNAYPPEPFPYYSAMATILSPPNSYEKLDWDKMIDWKALFYEALANLNYKLENFYEKHKHNG